MSVTVASSAWTCVPCVCLYRLSLQTRGRNGRSIYRTLAPISQELRSSFQSAGADLPLLKCCQGGLQGCGLQKWFTWCQFNVFKYSYNSSIFFFNSLTNEKGISNTKLTNMHMHVNMHSTIVIFASFIYFKSLSVLSLRLFRTFLQSLQSQPLCAIVFNTQTLFQNFYNR